MDHNNNNTTNSTTNRQQQQQTRDQQLSQKLQEQQNQQQQSQQNENQQQFCLRWHNHQTSLLSTLPILLDQSHLTDVTISAEGRTLRAHRVVLSACSSFFLEIFRTLENTHHPVIIIPGASFNAIVSLLTFMYSGEVNVYEEQIPMLLSLAETLGIKGLADVHNNKSHKLSTDNETLNTAKEEQDKSPASTSPLPLASAASTVGNFPMPQIPTTNSLNVNLSSSSSYNPLLGSALNAKFPSPLENFFLKSLQFYPNLMHHQPLNFSQTALNKTSELLAKYQQQCNLYQANLGLANKDLIPSLMHAPVAANEDESQLSKRFCSGLEKKPSAVSTQQMPAAQQMSLQQQKDIKRIDKIVENLRGQGASTKHENTATSLTSHLHSPLTPLSIKTSMENYSPNSSNLLATKPSLFNSPTSSEGSNQLHSQLPFNITPEDQLKLQQHLDKYAQSCARSMEAANENLKNEAARLMSNEKLTAAPQSPQTPKAPSNSKLYATCFICHKQLSNQYNLRVHLETHQNVRYACNVCSHVSRSKDALRKHVSYRHPGAPSPCETEARRKRANKVLASQLTAAANLTLNSPSSGEVTPTSPNALTHFPTTSQPTGSTSSTGPNTDINCNENSTLTAAQLSSAYQMFMPNQFHLAAAAVQQQQQQQQQQQNETQSSSSVGQISNKDFINTLSSSPSNHLNNLQTNTTTETTKSSPITSTSSTNATLSSSTNNLSTSLNKPNEIGNSSNTNNNNNEETRISPNLNT
ncbi:uncharacterized protein ACRADG_003567 isoform 2-T3 [Cochliomyia hominivorax]